LTWPLPEELDDAVIERLLFPPQSIISTTRQEPDWLEIHRELKRKGVTLALLWQEYKERDSEGYQYSWFCKLYNKWAGTIDLVMRQDHRAGEKMFVDYAGHTVEIVDRLTGAVRESQVFVAVLGASNYTYAEATWSQSLPDWIASHVRAFDFFGGVAEVVVPDNLKSGINKACFYEPDINPTYQDMATHYNTVILPARVCEPRDKAKVEIGVQVVERWILARLRNHTFFSLAELNREIRNLLNVLNNRPFKKLPGTRKSLFDFLDRPALKPLPSNPYQYAEWKKATVHIDYHIELDGHYYSVPHQLVKKKLDVRYSSTVVECYHRGKRIAGHRRSYQKGHHTTVREHMPARHQKYLDWTPKRFLRWAGRIGPHTVGLTERILASRSHPQQAYRTLLGILRLGKSYTDQRLEAACKRALCIGSASYRSVASILKNGLDNKPLPNASELAVPIQHHNIRGSQYYMSTQ
jgi:transposase